MSDVYIDTPETLASMCRELRDCEWLALDTEFLRERSYRPQLCLLQVATPDLVACVDTLAVRDLTPLLDLIYKPTITKVLHAARQDLEIFYTLRGTVPTPVFDTQLAAAILGYGEQMGYAALVKRMLGVSLAKSHTRTDWCQRPLSGPQLDYAADDVRYLRELYLRQRTALQSQGREEWLAEECAALASVGLYHSTSETAWRRVKGIGCLRGIHLAAAVEIAAWREHTARDSNTPRRWVLKDESILDLARLLPGDHNALKRIRTLNEAIIRHHGKVLLDLVASVQALPHEAYPQPEENVHLSDAQEALVYAMMALLRLCCQQQKISPSIVASRRDLELVVMGRNDLPLLRGWRGRVAGQAMLSLLRGENMLAVRDGALELKAS